MKKLAVLGVWNRHKLQKESFRSFQNRELPERKQITPLKFEGIDADSLNYQWRNCVFLTNVETVEKQVCTADGFMEMLQEDALSRLLSGEWGLKFVFH